MDQNKKALALLLVAIDAKIEKGLNLNQACIEIAKKLGYGKSYIFDMYKGKAITDRAAKRIIKALSPQRKRFRLWTEFHTLEEWEQAGKLSGDERRQRLLR